MSEYKAVVSDDGMQWYIDCCKWVRCCNWSIHCEECENFSHYYSIIRWNQNLRKYIRETEISRSKEE